MSAARVKPDQVLRHPCPTCGQKANRWCLSVAGPKKGMPMFLDGRQRFHEERSALARASIKPVVPVEKPSAKPHAWRSSACLPRRV